MTTNNSDSRRYRLLEEILKLKGLSLQATYSNKDLARIFEVSIRAIQNRVASGQLIPRNLPGRARYLTQDLEDFLLASRKGGC